MGGSTETFLSLAQGLEENLGRAVRQLKAFNDVSQNVNKTCTETQKTTKKISDNYDEISKSAERATEKARKWDEVVDSVKNNLKAIPGLFLAGFAGFSLGGAIKEAATLHQNMRDISYQMGLGAKGAKYLENAVMDIATTTGFAVDEVESMMTTLAKGKIPVPYLKALVTDSLRFTQITGANSDAVAQMTSNLVVMGGLGQKNISNMMGDLVQVQRAFGISGEEVTALTGNISDTTYQLRNMGKSAGEIERFQKGTMKLAGAFASVGLKAQDATAMIEKLLDPGALEDNALLYAKLGISIEDAMGGNIDPGQLTAGLQGIGKELQNMSGPQANALAQSLGVPLQQLRQMGNMDMSEIQKTFGGLTGSSDSLAKAQDDQATGIRDMAQAWEKIKATIGNIAIKFMPIFDVIAKIINKSLGGVLGTINGFVNSGKVEKVINSIVAGIQVFAKVIQHALSFLSPKMMLIGIVALVVGVLALKGVFSRTFYSIKTDMIESAKDMGSILSKGVSAGLSMGAEKSKDVYAAKMEQGSRVVGDGLRKRIVEGTHYAAISSAAEYQRLLGGTNTFGWAKAMNNNTAEWLDKIKNGAKPLSLFATYYKNSQDSIKEKIKLSGLDYARERDFLSTKNIAEKALAKLQQDRIDALEGMDRGTEEEKELSHLLKAQKELNVDIINQDTKIEDLNKRATDARRDLVSKLAPQEKALLVEQLAKEQEKVQEQKQALEARVASAGVENDLLTASKACLINQQSTLKSKIDSGNASIDELEAYKKVNNALKDNEELFKSNTELINGSVDELKDMEKSTKDIAEEMEHAAKGSGKTGALWKSWGRNLKDAASGAIGIVGAGFAAIGTKLKGSFVAAGEAVKQAMNPKNWIASIRNMGSGSLLKGGAKLAGKAVKGVGMAAGIAGGAIGLISGLMSKSPEGQKAMEKIQALLASVMGKVANALIPIIDILLPIIMNLVKMLFPIIIKIINALLPPLMNLIKLLLPPLLFILGLLLKILGTLISTIGSMISSLGFKEVGNAIKEVGDGIIAAGDGLMMAASEMAAANKLAAQQAAKTKIGDSATRALTEQLGITVEESQKMTVDELVSSMGTNKVTENLRAEMVKNTEALGNAFRTEKEKEISDNVDAQIKNLKSVKQSAADKVAEIATVDSNGNITINPEYSPEKLFDVYKALIKSAGDTGSFGANRIAEAEQLLHGNSADKPQQLLAFINNLSSFNVGKKERNNAIDSASGNIDKEILSDLTNDTFKKFADASGYKNFQGGDKEIIGFIDSFKAKDKTMFDSLTTLRNALNLVEADNDVIANFSKVLGENSSDRMLAQLLLEQVKLATKKPTPSKDDGTPAAIEGLTTTLYPAIMEATASRGLVMTQQARAQVQGGTPAEQAVAVAKEAKEIAVQQLAATISLLETTQRNGRSEDDWKKYLKTLGIILPE